MASEQYGFDHQSMEIFNDELMIKSLLEEESPVENHSSINEEEEEKLNRVIRSLEVEINVSSSPIESRKMDLQQSKSGLEDDFRWLNDFDVGVISSQNDDEMMNWCTELSYMDGVDTSVLEIEGADYYSHINYGLTFEEPTYSLWQDNNDVVMY
ncbi:unnamed protein product [Arabis nemorensis]|uniref:Uncharacterized protein n=1 Tax=Arabis nemorensis TaxID=586526 RepID=A0A565B8G6_9BRAS|nr:unnamed protein product [Arabis nemorensis]